MHIKTKKSIISWAFYDWANSAYATVVLAGFFPLFFKQYWSSTTDVSVSTFQLGLANSVASTIIVILAPLLGAIADANNSKKKLLLVFAVLGILMSGSLYFVAQHQTLPALVLFVLSAIGFSGSVVFYDALIVNVCDTEDYDRVSSLGYALGYLGGGLLFAVDVYMTLHPQVFGFTDTAAAVRYSFLSVSVWWFIFSLPLFFNVHEIQTTGTVNILQAIKAGVSQLKNTFYHIKKLRVVFLFLLAYWLYIDGVDTIVRMAVDYGMSLGFNSGDLIMALLITQFVGFPSAIAFGLLANYIGTKRGILLGILIYIIVTVIASRIQSSFEFYLLAVMIGLVQGGVQALSRSFYARIIPLQQSAEFFGFYNMLGKFAAVIGPVMMGIVSVITREPRTSILSISILFLLGGILLYFVDEQKAKKMLTDYIK